MQNSIFISQTYGELVLKEVRQKILDFMEKDPQSKYHIVIGSDSQPKNGHAADFISALVVHRVGKGGIYFWKRSANKKTINKVSKEINKLSLSRLRERIYKEASLSLELADEFLEVVKNDGITKYDVEIHVDIGNAGATRDMINEVVGMVRGSGFNVKTKPDSYGASKIADRHT